MRIDQVVPGLVVHDAISNHVRQVRGALREAGYDSDIWAQWIAPELADEGRPYRQCPDGNAERVLVYHASTHSPMAGWLVERALAGERVVTNYHNVTPPVYFARWLPEATAGMVAAREELRFLAPHARLGIGVSGFNSEELVRTGYRRVVTAPLLVDLEAYHATPDRRTIGRLRREQEAGTRWLFVGRIAPNKCQHDVIAAFALYRRLYDPRARLSLVGGATAPRYLAALHRLAADLDLGGSVEMVDSVSDEVLLSYFATADAFVCLSEHEGFCVPVLEAMELGLPVIAYAAAALPETVADGGLVLGDKDPLVVATAVGELIGDPDRRQAVIDAGRRRAADFSLARTSARMVSVLAAEAGPATATELL